MYATIEDADLVLIGSNEPLVPSPRRAASLWRWPRVVTQLEEIGFNTPMDVVSLYQLDREAVLQLGGLRPLNTDDNMVIEYSAPLHLHVDTQDENFELLDTYASVPYRAVGGDDGSLAELARAYQRRTNTSKAIATMAEAIRRSNDPQVREARLQEAEEWQLALELERGMLDEEDEG